MKPATKTERTLVVSWLAAPVDPEEPVVPLPDVVVPFLPFEDEDEDEEGLGDATRHIVSQGILALITSGGN
jgi:hypothetical protein